jgi:membrane associated rhomboid family serine protease
MVPASVGFHCPDDVREGARTVRAARTSFGGRVSVSAGRVTGVIVGVNVAVHLLGYAIPGLELRFGDLGLAVLPDGPAGVAAGEYYRLLTSAFLHANLLHLAMNMFALVTIGPPLERELGTGRFVALYVLSALGGSTLSFLVSEPTQLGVGASGAIFGLFGAFYVVSRRLGRETGQIVVLLVVNLVITFSVPVIDWRAHLGGLATGALSAAVLAYAPAGRQRSAAQAVGLGAVAVLLVAGVALRVAALR